jgi:hypothetical protein
MTLKNYYASIAIVEVNPGETISIESISVTKTECTLSGAWTFPINEKQSISSVLQGKIILSLEDQVLLTKLMPESDFSFIEVNTFLQEAKKAAVDATNSFEIFRAEDEKKRKKMVAPTFFSWPDNLDLNQSSSYLESIGKMSVPSSTPIEMKRVLAAARLVKFLIDMWQQDEQERNNRRYVAGTEAEITILPEVWLKNFATL